jgi:ArsR family transcriptional regulator
MVLNAEQTLKVFKAFDDVNRIKIINLLAIEQMTGCKILEKMDVSQPTLSHHMKILCDSGIVNKHKNGKWTMYSLSPEGIEKAINLLACLKGLYN